MPITKKGPHKGVLFAPLSSYVIALRGSAGPLHRAAEDLATLEFSSARMALITAERTLNAALYRDHVLASPNFEAQQFWA